MQWIKVIPSQVSCYYFRISGVSGHAEGDTLISSGGIRKCSHFIHFCCSGR